MHVSVTQKHIDRGLPCGAFECPIALAIQEQYPTYLSVEVDCQSFNLEREGENYQKYSLPKTAQIFIRRFDMKKSVESFEFEAEEKR